ncbi:MAG: hypothetical protein M3R70_00815 [Actinomycetota bacterium]|nr:hypothetical protein [Actinomycetota bacterium]
MHKARLAVATVALSLAALAAAPLALAEATRTWVSGVGDDANPCSRTAPCKTFAGAISKTAARGTINALDPGGFGAVTIYKPITINGRGAMAGILAAGTTGVRINIDSANPNPPGPNDRVILRNLDIEGVGTGISGIQFIKGKSLSVSNTNISGFTNGIWMNGPGKLTVRNSQINEGTYGILAGPATGTVKASIINTDVFGATWGIYSGAVGRMSVSGGEFADNGTALAARNGGTLNVRGALVEGNGIGLVAESGGKLRAAFCTVTDNVLGLSFTGGQLISHGGNVVEDNDTDGSFSSTLPTK